MLVAHSVELMRDGEIKALPCELVTIKLILSPRAILTVDKVSTMTFQWRTRLKLEDPETSDTQRRVQPDYGFQVIRCYRLTPFLADKPWGGDCSPALDNG
jgi:hypothetical protein